jgi:Tfp pilus assembly protein PilP
MIFKSIKLLVLILIFNVQFSFAQQDGLDENSFNDSAPGSAEQPGATVDEFGQEQPVDDLDINSANPEFDRGAIPENEAQEVLTDEIKNLNPDSLSVGQDIFPIFIYEDRGRKDPFAPVYKIKEKPLEDDGLVEEKTDQQKMLDGLGKFEVASLTLTAILMGKSTKPKALIKDPTGAVYQIHENDIIGRNNGVVKKIRQGQIVIVEYRDQKDGERLYTTQVLSLGK